MVMTVQRATIGDYLKFYKDIIPGWVIWNNGQRIGILGFSYNVADHRYWGYFDLREKLDPDAGRRLVQNVRSSLKGADHDLVVLCQKETFETAPRLCRILGFKPTGEFVEGNEIWIRPASVENNDG